MAPLFTANWFNFGRNPSSAGGSTASPFSGTGGEVTDGVSPGNGYTYHYYKTPGNFTVSPGYDTQSAPDIAILVVAAGGGGGPRSGGGGGAGGVVAAPNITIPITEAGVQIPVTVGTSPGIASGNNSAFGDTPKSYYMISTGGGRAGYDGVSKPGAPGGSGGGAQYNGSGGEGTQTPQASTQGTGYGNDGGTGDGPDHNSGGGGGAGGAATPGSGSTRGSAGGSVSLPIFDVDLYMPAPDPYRPDLNPLPGIQYGGGGGAGAHPTARPDATPTSAAQGGGGLGGPHTNGNGSQGKDGLGGGGGGGVGSTPGPVGGRGGHGIVVVRYTAS